ncbi:hypothetical protein [Sabulicella glaciei]|uniref:Uncharacterized protein n=1 Tax=Sabulicella glaciei TaxID=2984948 RepID=A0ABT3P076_9PROT|nr:hypothetical protein [Roseococcus sp. MDT2-1-1]MCW8087578.1 hypothetical protein [Roseococcus sp. MDT2-1-1]
MKTMQKMIVALVVIGAVVPAIPLVAQIAAAGIVDQVRSVSAAPSGPQTGFWPDVAAGRASAATSFRSAEARIF